MQHVSPLDRVPVSLYPLSLFGEDTFVSITHLIVDSSPLVTLPCQWVLLILFTGER